MTYFLDMESLAAHIRAKRGQHGLRKTATQINVSATTLYRIEHGEILDLQTLLSVCDWLGVSPSQFIRNNEQPEPQPLNALEQAEILLRSQLSLDDLCVDAFMTLLKSMVSKEKQGCL